MSWEDELPVIRATYRREAGPKLDAMARLVDGLEQGSAQGVGDLRTGFHGFRGSGLTYGLPEVSALGTRGEETCRRVAETGGPPTPANLGEWRALLEALRVEFRKGEEPRG